MGPAYKRTLLGLCRQAQREGVLHLKSILEAAGPGDVPLQRYLEDRLKEAREDLEEWARPGNQVPADPAQLAQLREIQTLLRSSFPSRSRSLGEGPLERDVAMYLVECDLQEEAAFLRGLAARTPIEDWRHYFGALAERLELRIRKSREVLIEAGLEFAGR